MQEKENVMNILGKARKAIINGDAYAVKDLSNRTIHSSAIAQDPDNVNIAVVLYALSKIIERDKYRDYASWPRFKKIYEQALDNALIALKKGDIEVYRDQINRIKEAVEKLSGNLKKYIEEVFRKASINKGSRIYEHGISLEKTAKILGISQWDLASYIGQTGLADVNLTYTKDLRERIKDAQEIFR